jgi:hypothetical protein
LPLQQFIFPFLYSKPINHGIEDGTEVQTKGIEIISSEVIAEKCPNLGK